MILCVVLLLLFSPVQGETANSRKPLVATPLMKSLPVIDGLIHDKEWRDATRVVGFVSHGSNHLAARRGTFWFGCDGRQLFIAVRSEIAPDGKILNRALPNATGDSRAALLDDSIELVLDPKRGRTTGDRAYYHIISNGRGALFDRSVNPDDKRNPLSLSWRLPGWTFKNSVEGKEWHVELAIPLKHLGVKEEDLKRPWGLRIGRNWRRPGEQAKWESIQAAYLDQPSMPVVRWDPAAPVVQVLSLFESSNEATIKVSVRNPRAQAIEIQALLSDAWHRNPARRLSEKIQLGPGQVRPLLLEAPDGGAEGLHHTIILLSSPGGETVYFHRDFTWNLHRPKTVWSLGKEESRAVALQFKYYPYLNKIRLALDIGSLATKDKVERANLSIVVEKSGKESGTTLWKAEAVFAKYHAGGTFDIPDLPDGKYQLVVRLAGRKGITPVPVIQPFIRKHFEWEHNQLGFSDEVMPPFTALEVRGQTVRAVLRAHRHGSTGLWDSLRSKGRELLTKPMRWEVLAAPPGQVPKLQTVKGSGWIVNRHRATEVRGSADWSAGPLNGHLETAYDYDGMMLCALELEPTGQSSIHRLSLVIPLNNEESPVMHAVGDGLRHNYAGFVPSGQGKIWDSSKGNKLEITGTFFPYLWVGGAERGLAWFADNDRDWALDDSTPTLELYRSNQKLTLKVNLVTKPGPLTRRRRIVFGLQATPTKPMPEGWRRWIARKRIPGTRTVSWMGANYYWGGLAYDVYPRNRDFRFYKKMREARETGKFDDAFLQEWLQPVVVKYGRKHKRYTFFRNHVYAGMRSAAGATFESGTRLFGYTNARGAGFHTEEWPTFQDEWIRSAFYHRNWSPAGAVGYDISPCRSFQDYAIWYYRKMLQCMDGVYWDNTFLSAQFDPLIGGAWTDAKGRPHPGMGLFHLRNLIKRSAIMLWQAGKKLPQSRQPFLTLSHMTNTMIVPVLSFGNCNMDWEWKYGYEDFQDRFSPDLTVAETLGRQVGAWPTILAGGHPKVDDPRVPFMYRTRLGVTLVHEISVFDYRPKMDTEIYTKLFEFGYGTPSCEVFNYWQENHPVSVAGAGLDCRTLVISRKGAAIVVVTDYGEGGSARVQVDLQQLGLPRNVSAKNLETGHAIERAGPGLFQFPLKKHDFRILVIQ